MVSVCAGKMLEGRLFRGDVDVYRRSRNVAGPGKRVRMRFGLFSRSVRTMGLIVLVVTGMNGGGKESWSRACTGRGAQLLIN